LTQARAQAAQALIRNHADLVEPDNLGRPVVRHEVLALSPSPQALAGAARAGFRVRASETMGDLGVTDVVLETPRGVSAVEAVRRLRAMDPAGQYDFNHLYQQGGQVAAGPAPPSAAAPEAAAIPTRGVRVGLVDGGVAATQPTLSEVPIVQKAFAPGGPRPSPHGTAVASLIAGRKGVFRGAAPGAALLVADVYGATPAGGSAEAIVRALAWLAAAHAPVINISLVGPPNLLLETAVKALVARGHLVVAAVGNDGPAAAPLYPASYPGVIAVTGVDPDWRVLPEAGRATHVDFAAPGSEMAAAGLDGGFVSVRGTSFAAPLTAGLLAKLIAAPDRKEAERAVSTLGRRALDLGPRGPDSRYGRGVVAVEFRTPPGEVRATQALRGP
jgi:subtilisin family serine protease